MEKKCVKCGKTYTPIMVSKREQKMSKVCTNCSNIMVANNETLSGSTDRSD